MTKVKPFRAHLNFTIYEVYEVHQHDVVTLRGTGNSSEFIYKISINNLIRLSELSTV